VGGGSADGEGTTVGLGFGSVEEGVALTTAVSPSPMTVARTRQLPLFRIVVVVAAVQVRSLAKPDAAAKLRRAAAAAARKPALGLRSVGPSRDLRKLRRRT
jgi:hypothetical protein